MWLAVLWPGRSGVVESFEPKGPIVLCRIGQPSGCWPGNHGRPRGV